MGTSWCFILVALLLTLCTIPAQCASVSDTPSPPELKDPSMATAVMTIERRNVTTNATIYYSFSKDGKLRVDQDAGGGQIHTYIGDWKSKMMFWLLSKDQCFAFSNPNAVPDPQFFSNAKFMGRVNIDGLMTQHWCVTAHGEQCHGEGKPNHINLYVKDANPSYPVRICFFGIRLDIVTFKPGWAGNPEIWNIPSACHTMSESQTPKFFPHLL